MHHRRTKIVATLGPATDPPGLLDQLIAAGMDCARSNCSHGTHDDLRRRALEVRAAGDRFSPWTPPDPDAPGLRAGGLELTLGGLTAAAQELAARLGLGEGDRVLVDEATAAEAGPVAWLLAPLAAGASLVLCRHPDAAGLAARAAAERVTATLGPEIDGIRVLGRPV